LYKQRPGFIVSWMKSLLPIPERPNFFSVLFLVLLGVAYLPPFADMDYAMLIRSGERIVQTGQLRPAEGFSYTIAGKDVPDFEWLFEIIVWGLWTAFGYGGLKLFKVMLIGATLLLLAWRLRRQGVRGHGIVLTVLVAVVYLASGWNLRPMYVTSLGLLLVSGWLHDHCTGRRPLSWWLPVIMLLWANLHPGVITGQGLLAGAIAWEWLNRWLRLNTPLSAGACWRLTRIAGLGLAATFIAPNPIERLLAPFQPELRHPIQRVIIEMRPLWETVTAPPYEGLPVYALAALIGLTVVLRFRHYRLWEVGLLAGLGLLANLAIRSTQDWVLLLLASGVPHLAALLAQWAHEGRRRWWVARLLRLDASCRRLLLSPVFRCQWQWPAVTTVFLAVVSLTPPLSRLMPMQESDKYPIATAAWIESHGLPGKGPWHIFGRPDDGAYLIWRLGDRVRCYADTRSFCYPPEIFADSYYVPILGPDWRSRLKRVLTSGTDYLLLTTKGNQGRLWQALREQGVKPLHGESDWVLLSADEVRRGLHEGDSSFRASAKR
jgi:hypothetical protein